MLQYYHMLEFYQKRSWRAVVYSPITVAILLLVCIGLARIVYDRYTIERDMYNRRLAAEAEVVELQARKASLEEKVEYLSHERGIEAEMRRNFDVAQPGEKVVIILDEKPASDIVPLSTSTAESNAPWYIFWR